jgi:hypothetical protein
MQSKPHNNYCQLVSIQRRTDKGYVELVYAQNNGGGNEGLEAYYHKGKELGHYISFRWLEGNIPLKHQKDYEMLKELVKHCPHGHKLELDEKV